jgi:hypothetical protein
MNMVKQRGHLLMEFTQKGKLWCIGLTLHEIVHPLFFHQIVFGGLYYVPIKTCYSLTCSREIFWCFGGMNLIHDSIFSVVMVTLMSIFLQNDKD